MNQSLNEFMRTLGSQNNKSPLNKSTTDPNLDITNLDEDDSVVYQNPSATRALLNSNVNASQSQESNMSDSKPTLNANSSTAEFKKYLDDVKKNYLEKLTFSCPSKVSYKPNSIQNTTTTSTTNNNVSYKLKSVENINSLLASRATPVTSLLNQANPARRSLFFDSRINEETSLDDDDDDSFKKKSSNELADQFRQDDLFQAPDLTKSQILSRLVQIREYLKQSYSMLSTLETSNELTNYATQMSKLHSLIDHLKEQEKAYLDLLNSFSKYQQLTSSLTSENVQRDLLDLTDLNESVHQQYKLQQQSQLSKSVAVQTNLNEALNSASVLLSNSKTNNTITATKRDETNLNNEESIANSLSGSFISDTLTLNGVNCDGLYKYKNNPKTNSNNHNNKSLIEHDKNENELIVIGKGYNLNAVKTSLDDDENKTENDLDLLEYEDEEAEAAATSNENRDKIDENEHVKEQRREIMSALDNDLITLEQLREQKKLLKSIRLRKEELKALEGRRKALEALRLIAMDNETQIDQVYSQVNNSQTLESEDSTSKSMNNAKSMLRKTFKHSDSFETKLLSDANLSGEESDADDEYVSPKSKIESLSQLEKVNKLKQFEDLAKTSSASNKNNVNNSLLKMVTYPSQRNNDEENEEDEEEVNKREEEKETLNRELSQKMIDLAENEKKLE